MSTVPRAEAAALGVRVPDEAGDAVRIVEAEGFDRQACGGTHPRRTSEVGVVLVLGHERYKGGTRVRFVCGDRALAAVRCAHGDCCERLAPMLSAGWPEAVPEQVVRLLDEQARRRQAATQELRERALEGEAHRLLAQRPSAGGRAARSSTAAMAARAARPGRPIVELRPASRSWPAASAKAQLVFARSAGLSADVTALLQVGRSPTTAGAAAAAADMAQGGCDRIGGLEAAASSGSRPR